MNRRSFLHTSGTFSLMGLGLPAGILAYTGKRSSDVYQWLSQLADATGAHRQYTLWGHPETLREQIQRTNAFMAARSFISGDSGLFFYPGGKDHCFYPLVLRHAGAGLTDLMLPVLAQQPDGTWHQLMVLTSYQLEALARAAAHLPTQNAPVAELLLPAGPMKESGVFPTARGSVRMITRLQSGTATTHIVVHAGREVVFSENFTSEHCLSSTAAVQA